MNEAKSLEKTDPTKANADYVRAVAALFFRDAGQSPPLPASSVRIKKQSRLSWHTRASGIRRLKL